MSNKSGRRSRRATNEDETSFKPPHQLLKNPEEPLAQSQMIDEQNGNGEKGSRSRSSTPKKLRKTEDKALNGSGVETGKIPEMGQEIVVETEPQPAQEMNGHSEPVVVETEPVEMDPLILTDDPDPELVFDDNSDLESGQESPAASRCRTRRSQTRNIPTPKTPKVDDDLPTPPLEQLEEENDLNLTFVSLPDDMMSTNAEAGSDSTRINYMADESDANSFFDSCRKKSSLANNDDSGNNFLETSKNQSFGETLKKLSTRRTIRPISDVYKKRVVLHSNLDAKSRPSVEKILEGGIKRKICGEYSDRDDQKRFKADSPGFFSRIISPLANIRNSFRGDNVVSSTPKLTAYKDKHLLTEQQNGDENKKKVIDDDNNKNVERGWCSIM